MSERVGVAPPDLSTLVGELRTQFGDVEWVELDPPLQGFGSYNDYSDDELGTFLDRAGSVEGAMALIFLQMAGAAARESMYVGDFDLRVDLTKRAKDLREMAKEWQALADGLQDDFFEVFTPVRDDYVRPELAPFRWC